MNITTNGKLELNQEPKTYILIDGSYFCFYRYYALKRWWQNAFTEEELNIPIENQIFVDKFEKIFIDTIKQLPKKLKIPKNEKVITIVGKDCKRENIWRNSIYPKYKATRDNEKADEFLGGPFFNLAYNKLFEQSGVLSKNILYHPQLEADDCIAIYTNILLKKNPYNKIYIITGDHDYLQLQNERIHICNLKYELLKNKKDCIGDAHKDLLLKILVGDISDNIPQTFPKCGIKTAINLIEDKEKLQKKLNENKLYREQYELNEQLISFEKIPEILVNEFINGLVQPTTI